MNAIHLAYVIVAHQSGVGLGPRTSRSGASKDLTRQVRVTPVVDSTYSQLTRKVYFRIHDSQLATLQTCLHRFSFYGDEQNHNATYTICYGR